MPTITTAFPSPSATAKKLGVAKSRLIWIERQADLATGHARIVRNRKKKTSKPRA
jgi:hypothetical protein